MTLNKAVILFALLSFLSTAETSARIIVDHDPITKGVRIIDSSNGKIIYEKLDQLGYWISPQQSNLCDRTGQQRGVEPVITIDVVKEGVDITYTFHNSGSINAPIGEFYLGKFNLDSTVYWRNTNYTFNEEVFQAERNVLFLSQANIYPSTTAYSPVTVLRDEDYIIGVSVMYPFTTYRHTINQLVAGTFYDDLPAGWEVVIQANAPCNSQIYQSSGDLKPGELRVYKIALRVHTLKNVDTDWKKVIQPYKLYYTENYGRVQYRLDSKPIIGYHGVSTHLQTNDNPYGYWNVGDEQGGQYHPLRPDKFGFGPTTDYLKKMLLENKCKRLMLWAPTGLYFKHPERNYPFHFTSRWADPEAGTPSGHMINRFVDVSDQLMTIATKRTSFGLWWGHAIYIAQDWDTPAYEIFDPDNDEHWDMTKREMDGALATEAEMIGLDSYNDLPGWDQLIWLDSMRLYSDNRVKFIAEQYSFDAAHTRAAFFYATWNVHGRHVLADYLNPGNEKWILLLPDQMDDLEGYARKAAGWGFNACKMTYLGAPFHKLYKSRR